MRRSPWMLLPLAALLFAGADAAAPPAERLTFKRIARFPPPGARIPGSFKFTHDGKVLYFLGYAGEGAARSLFREVVATGERSMAATAQGEGGAASLSRDEVLRRERLRIQELGITQYVLAERADRIVYMLGGIPHLLDPGQPPRPLLDAAGGELDPQLSPDGGRLAYVRAGDLHILDLKTRRETRLTSGARDGVTHGLAEYIAQEEMDRPNGYWWSPDGVTIAYTEVDETGIPVYPIVHQGQPTWDVENHRYPFAGGPNATVRLGVVPSRGGTTRWLTLWDRPKEDFYLARVRFAPDGALLAQVQSRDQRQLRLLRFAPKTFARTVLIDEQSPAWIALSNDLKPLTDGRFLWSSESGGSRQIELRAADGSLVRTLTPGPEPVDRIEGVDEERGFVYFTAALAGPLHKPLYHVPLAGGAVERVTAEDGFHLVEMTSDARRFVDVHDSARTPPRVLLRQADGLLIRVLDANEDREPAALGLRPPEFVTLRGPDGTLLHGALYKPRDAKANARYPAIVRVYGGPTSQQVKDSWEITQDLRAQHLTDRGYVVFRLDNRGTPRRGREFETALYRRLGSVEVEDQVAGARYLATLPFVDRDRIGIYGWSYGGYVAALCLLRAPEVFRAAVVGAPVTDWDGYDTHYTERYMGTPRDNPEGYRAASVLPLAPKLEGRLLVVHGMADENVHFRHTARLLNALNAERRRYDVLLFPDERHLPRKSEDREYLEQRLVEHFDEALKPR